MRRNSRNWATTASRQLITTAIIWVGRWRWQVAQTYYKYYEVGNELDSAALAGNYDGNIWYHYSNQPFMVAHGLMRDHDCGREVGR